MHVQPALLTSCAVSMCGVLSFQAEQVDAGDDEANTCLVEDAGLPQGNFRAQLDDFNEGKLLRISADALVAGAPDSADTTGFLVRDEDFWVKKASGIQHSYCL